MTKKWTKPITVAARVDAISNGSAISPTQQRLVHHPVLPQHQKPGIGPHDIGRPERQHSHQQRQPLPAGGHPKGDDRGQRVGKDDRNRRSPPP
jgi:hypothetical protein